MPKHSLATLINFCTNEKRFIRPCIEQAQIFSKQVIVAVASHFFDGSEENRELLEQIYAAFPKCLFIEYPFLPQAIPKRIFRSVRPEAFWHCLSRLIGVLSLDPSIESVLFLDADEIVDGYRMAEWLDCSGYECHTVLRLANYWYFREPIYQADRFEDSAILAQKRALSIELLLHNHERDAVYDGLPGPKRRMVMGTDGVPLLHHFSWVRTEQEMLKKVQAWGHRKDRNWEELVKKEFQGPFQGTDFVHGYRFQTVTAPFQVMEEPVFSPQGSPNVRRLTATQVQSFVRNKKNFWLDLFDSFF